MIESYLYILDYITIFQRFMLMFDEGLNHAVVAQTFTNNLI